VAEFGEIAVPLNMIRGISWRDSGDASQRQATLFFRNSDTLTVSIGVPHLEMKTKWGVAIVELAQIRAILLTADKIKWSDTPDGRRTLVPDEPPESNQYDEQ
jgi:hypothetical protein